MALFPGGVHGHELLPPPLLPGGQQQGPAHEEERDGPRQEGPLEQHPGALRVVDELGDGVGQHADPAQQLHRAEEEGAEEEAHVPSADGRHYRLKLFSLSL